MKLMYEVMISSDREVNVKGYNSLLCVDVRDASSTNGW